MTIKFVQAISDLEEGVCGLCEYNGPALEAKVALLRRSLGYAIEQLWYAGCHGGMSAREAQMVHDACVVQVVRKKPQNETGEKKTEDDEHETAVQAPSQDLPR